MILIYFDIGKIIYELQNKGKWGDAIIPKLSRDIINDLPEIKGFSERNIKFMSQFFKEYNSESEIRKQPVSQIEEIKNFAVQIPWGHNIVIFYSTHYIYEKERFFVADFYCAEKRLVVEID